METDNNLMPSENNVSKVEDPTISKDMKNDDDVSDISDAGKEGDENSDLENEETESKEKNSNRQISENKHNFLNRMNMPDNISYVNSSFTFPQKLFHLLETDKYSDLVSWKPHGLSFQIFDEERFMEEVAPLYFKQKKWPSFQRQLNIYGFKKNHRGVDSGCYFHPYFQRGNNDMIFQIKRMPEKGTLPSYEEITSFLLPEKDRLKRLKKKAQPSLNGVMIPGGLGMVDSKPKLPPYLQPPLGLTSNMMPNSMMPPSMPFFNPYNQFMMPYGQAGADPNTMFYMPFMNRASYPFFPMMPTPGVSGAESLQFLPAFQAAAAAAAASNGFMFPQMNMAAAAAAAANMAEMKNFAQGMDFMNLVANAAAVANANSHSQSQTLVNALHSIASNNSNVNQQTTSSQKLQTSDDNDIVVEDSHSTSLHNDRHDGDHSKDEKNSLSSKKKK